MSKIITIENTDRTYSVSDNATIIQIVPPGVIPKVGQTINMFLYDIGDDFIARYAARQERTFDKNDVAFVEVVESEA